jgi:RNA polymerase sigma-70 factor (ECF subfamily)
MTTELNAASEQNHRDASAPTSEASAMAATSKDGPCQLLKHYGKTHDAYRGSDEAKRTLEAAAEALVKRYNGLVLCACSRILYDCPADIPDVAQATWLLFFRKQLKGAFRTQNLGSWLYQAATNLAMNERRKNVRRKHHERAAPRPSAGSDAADGPSQEDLAAVSEEVSCLSDKHRQVIIQRFFEGHSQEETARELGLPVGTVVSRTSRALDDLRSRLRRRGICLDPAALISALSSAPDNVPRPIATSTAAAAISLLSGVPAESALSPQACEMVARFQSARFARNVKMAAIVSCALLVLLPLIVIPLIRLRDQPNSGQRNVAPIAEPHDGVPSDDPAGPTPEDSSDTKDSKRDRHNNSIAPSDKPYEGGRETGPDVIAAIELNDPVGEYRLKDSERQANATVKGQIGRLRIGLMTRRERTLDLSELEAREVVIEQVDSSVLTLKTAGSVVFGGKIDGQSHVEVTTKGDVVFREKIDGQSQVQVTAQGNVTFADKIDGRSRIDVKCRNFTSGWKIDGESDVRVIYSGDAKVGEITGNSRYEPRHLSPSK